VCLVPRNLNVVIARDAETGLVSARGGDRYACGVLQRCGFLPVRGPGESCHRLPHGLAEAQEEQQCASRAARALGDAGYQVTLDPALRTEVGAVVGEPPVGAAIQALTQRLYHVGDTQQMSAVLTEFVAPLDGILPALAASLREVGFWCAGLGTPEDSTAAGELRQLARQVADGARLLGSLRDEYAEWRTLHPERGDLSRSDPEATQRQPRALGSAPVTGATPAPSAAPSTTGTSPAARQR
jgi:hypothetical protein